MSLQFDAETHTYWKDGAIIPSVTQILGAMTDLSMIREEVLEYAAGRGDAVHYGCELYDKGTLDWSSVQDELRPYIEAWGDFRAKTGFTPDRIEERVYHPHLAYAGTLDRAGIYDGQHAIIDIKAVAAMYPTTGPQTAAYASALQAGEPDAPKITARYAVQLLRTGKWKLHTYNDPTDFSVFVAMRTLIGWSNKNKQRISYDPAQ